MFRSLSALLIVSVASTSLWSAPILVDDFTVGPVELLGGSSVSPKEDVLVHQTDLPNVLGESRVIAFRDIQLNRPGSLISASVDTDAGAFQVSGDQDVEIITLSYTPSTLDLDLSTMTGVQLDILSHQSDSVFRPLFDITLTSKLPDQAHQQDTAFFTVPEAFDSGTIFFPAQRFDKVDLGHIVGVSVNYYPVGNTYSFQMGNILIVPEPGLSGLTVVLLTCGFFSLVRKRGC